MTPHQTRPWAPSRCAQRKSGPAKALGNEDRVGFLPFQRDPADVYRLLDDVAHASTRPEPFGLTIAEAMSVGKPVVVAAAGGALELFDDAHDALGHSPGDAESLAAQLTRLIRDPGLRLRLGENARRTAVQRFRQERFAKEIAWVVGNVLGRPYVQQQSNDESINVDQARLLR